MDLALTPQADSVVVHRFFREETACPRFAPNGFWRARYVTIDARARSANRPIVNTAEPHRNLSIHTAAGAASFISPYARPKKELRRFTRTSTGHIRPFP